MIKKGLLQTIDWFTLSCISLFSLFSLLFIYSSTTTPDIPYSIFLKKQIFGIVMGYCLFLIFFISDHRTLSRLAYFIYYIVVLLLVYTLIKGKIGMGAQRWIDLKLFRFQPSEVAKLFFPGFFSFFLFTEKDVPLYSFQTFIPLLGILAGSALLILKQPDLGTAIVFGAGGLLLLWCAGIGKKFFQLGLICAVLSAPLLWTYGLKSYQKQRVLVFLGAGSLLKERYHIEQSKIAIGSGGMSGKGFKKGTQNQFDFLPESRTDFIFSVICEELGFIGACFILLLYVLLFLHLLYKIYYIPFFFAQLQALGLLLPLMLSASINIGMVCGLLPIVGIPLPFISYGITATWIHFAALGWIENITQHEFIGLP